MQCFKPSKISPFECHICQLKSNPWDRCGRNREMTILGKPSSYKQGTWNLHVHASMCIHMQIYTKVNKLMCTFKNNFTICYNCASVCAYFTQNLFELYTKNSFWSCGIFSLFLHSIISLFFVYLFLNMVLHTTGWPRTYNVTRITLSTWSLWLHL